MIIIGVALVEKMLEKKEKTRRTVKGSTRDIRNMKKETRLASDQSAKNARRKQT